MSAYIDKVERRTSFGKTSVYHQLPRCLYLGSILYQCRLLVSIYQFTRQDHTMDYPPGECLWIYTISGDSHKYLFKRKALEVLVNQRQPRIPEACYSEFREALEDDLGTEGDIPQKKQKLTPESCSCSQNGICLECEEDRKRYVYSSSESTKANWQSRYADLSNLPVMPDIMA